MFTVIMAYSIICPIIVPFGKLLVTVNILPHSSCNFCSAVTKYFVFDSIRSPLHVAKAPGGQTQLVLCLFAYSP